MKLLAFTFFLMFLRQATAQDTSRVRVVVSFSGGAFLPWDPGKDVVEYLPYTSMPAGASVASSHTFQGSLGGDFYKAGYLGDIMNIEVTSKRHGINGGFGLFQAASFDDGGYLKGGYRWILPFHRKGFRLMPGIDLYGLLGSDIEMGRIDSKDQTIQLLGYSIAPQWTITYSGRYGTTTTTYSTDHVSVLYRRDALLIEPKIVVSINRKRLVLGLEAGWMLELAQGCAILLQQQDASGENRHTAAKIQMPRNGSLSGFYTAMRLGISNRSKHFF